MKTNVFEIFGFALFIFFIILLATGIIGGIITIFFIYEWQIISWILACLFATLCVLQIICNTDDNKS